MADPTQIHQILVNLCTNAAHAMRERGGVLEVKLEKCRIGPREAAAGDELERGQYLRLTVSDTGIGMDKATMERIFDPYYTTKEVGEGSGLGLAVVHGIVERHGGTIRVHSAPGKGSSFQVFLPKIAGRASPVSEETAPIVGGNERILLIEDEEAIATMEKRILAQLGYRVTVKMDSHKALDAFSSNPGQFDLVITDYTMPRMTGADLAGRILKIQPDIPIILCTGFNEQITEEKSKQIGISHFLMKPVNKRQIAEAIRAALAGK